MERTARLVLRRINAKGKRVRTTVAVQRITLGGFLALVRALAPRVAQAMHDAGRALTWPEMIAACADQDTLAFFADLVCVGRPVGFLKRWCPGGVVDGTPEAALERANAEALLAAARAVEGPGQWTRFIGTINQAPAAAEPDQPKAKKTKGGGLSADAEIVARLEGVPTWVVMDLPLQTFLDRCDSINRRMDEAEDAALEDDPLLNPNAEPTPLPKAKVH